MINSHREGVILTGNVFIIYIKTIRILRIFREGGGYYSAEGSVHLYTELWSTAETSDHRYHDARDMSFCF